MLKTVGIFLSLSIALMAAQTDTKVEFGAEQYKGADKYGNSVHERSVTIKTTDFKVDNFWKKFSWGGNSTEQEHFDLIETSGTVEVNVQSSFVCKDGGLDSTGCSGQKPFLINQGILNNADLKLDADGAQLPAGEYRIAFDSAGNYNALNDDAFYALDVYRDGKYYNEGTAADAANEKPTTFFGAMFKIISSFFSASAASSLSSVDSPDLRNRYMANITFGLQEAYLLEKDTNGILNTSIQNAANSTQATLLDYNEDLVEGNAGCNIFFLTLNSSSFTCKAVSFFGLSSFIPFINTTSEVKLKPDLVAEDTETTLLSLAGKLDGVNYLNTKQTETVSGRTTFISEMFKPMTFIFDSIFRLFGISSSTEAEVVSVDFNFTNPMPLTFLETDGLTVTDFLHFTLLGLESTYGTEVESCTIKHKTGTMFMMPIYSTDLYENDGSVYHLKIVSGMMGFGTYYIDVPSADLMDWCNRYKDQSSGMFGGFFSFFSSFGTSGSGTYDTDLQNGDYSVVSYEEKVHKGLILHLKKQENGFAPEMIGSTSTYKLMNITRGN